MEGGASNLSYLLDTARGDYVLTHYSLSLTRAIRIGQLLMLLAEHGIPTKRLVPPTTGGLVVVYGDRPAMLTEYIAGQVCPALDETMLRQAGWAMAELHRVPAPDFLADEHAYGHQVWETVIGLKISAGFESWLWERRARLEQSSPADLPRGLIHGDLFYDNVLFEGKNLRAIIDLEEAYRYYKVFDLSMALVGLCREGPTIALEKARALVSGYQQVRKLAETEKDALQLFAEYAAAGTAYWRFWRYQVHTPSLERADRHKEMVRLAKEIAAIPAARFRGEVFALGAAPVQGR
jgi:homoserine kinase type II